jgi:hypothetical protein
LAPEPGSTPAKQPPQEIGLKRRRGTPPSWAALFTLALGIPLAAPASPARAASGRDDLLRLVPGDVGFCVVLSDLRGQTEKLLASGWVKRLRDAPLVKALAQTPEARKLRDLDARLQKQLKVSFVRLWTDLLGDAVVFAYRPGPPDKPEEEQGLLLICARDPDLLARVVKLLNSELKKPEERVYKEVKYFRRVEGSGKVNYYFLNGKELAFSSAEDMVRQVIDRTRDRKAKGKGGFSLQDRLRRLGADNALLAVWFNPRAFTPHLRKKAAALKGADAAFQNFMQYWKALEGMALTVSLRKDVAVKVAVRADPKKLPAPARRFFTEASKPSELWGRFPPNALVAMAGRIDAVAFAEFLGEFLPAEGKKAFRMGLNRGVEAGLGLNVSRDVLPRLGPDWGFCLTAPADKDVLLPLLTWALQVQPGPSKPGVDKALFNGLNAFALYAVLGYNTPSRADKLELKTTFQDKVEVKYLKNDKAFPPGFRPAFALKEGYLVVASSPEAVRTFGKGGQKEPEGKSVPLLRMSLGEWARFLKGRREPLVKHLAQKDDISREEAGRRLDGLLWGLSLFDRLELSQQTGDGLATWTLLLGPAEGEKVRG